LERVPGAQHTGYHERFAPRRKRAAVAAYFVNAISGERDAVRRAPWQIGVVASGKNLTTIYATHGHGDHFFGTSTVLERFSGARFVARPDVIKVMRQQASPESLATFGIRVFPARFPAISQSPKRWPETSLTWKATI